MTAKEQGLPEAAAWLCVSPDGFQRDATTSAHARDTYARAGRIITPLAALASDTGERGVVSDGEIDAVLNEVLQMVDPFNPPPAGSYNRGRHEGIVAAVKTVRDLLPRVKARTYPFAALRAQPAGGGEWLDCGHHESLMLKSAETGLPLYCELCDARTCSSDNAIDAIEWKERALAAEADIERMTDAFNRENGPTFMGEPVLPPEKMVELEEGVQVPKWLLDHTRRIELYMKANLPGPWRFGGVQSHDYACATPPESGGQGWLPIESAPATGLLLTFHPRFGQRILRPDPHNAGWYLDETGGPTREVTHWMPLPAAPAQPDGVRK